MKSRILIGALLFSASVSLAGTLYRWVDSDGTVHYSDQPPPPSIKDVQEKKLGANVIEGDPTYALEQAVKKFPVTLYTTACGLGCYLARQLLSERGVPYAEKNPNQEPESAEALKKIVGELLVPTLLVGNTQPLKGFQESAWNSALDAAGYPKTSVPAPEGAKAIPPAKEPAPPGASVAPAESAPKY